MRAHFTIVGFFPSVRKMVLVLVGVRLIGFTIN